MPSIGHNSMRPSIHSMKSDHCSAFRDRSCASSAVVSAAAGLLTPSEVGFAGSAGTSMESSRSYIRFFAFAGAEPSGFCIDRSSIVTHRNVADENLRPRDALLQVLYVRVAGMRSA